MKTKAPKGYDASHYGVHFDDFVPGKPDEEGNPTYVAPKWAKDVKPEPEVFPNKFPGKCGNCQTWIGEGAGRIEKVAGKWVVFHRAECPERQVEAVAPAEGLDLSGLPSGYYAVPGGDTRLKVRIAHGKPGSKWEGWTFVSDGAAYGQRTNYGSQRPEGGYRGRIETELRAIAEAPLEAMKAYGNLVGRCGSCNAILEDETSIANGIGPVCAQKF